MTAPPIDFYFEFASPYGYMAATRIDAVAAKYGASVTWRPILLGAIFKTTGSKPNMDIPLKGPYLLRDVPRSARLMGLDLTLPAKMPVNGLAACRAFYWLDGEDPDLAKRLALALYREHWGEGRDVSSAARVKAVAAPLGIDPDALDAGIRDEAVKDRLKAENDAAVGRGVFGSPFVLVGDEPFWGADRLDQVERWLATGGW